jgi:hypothetical protein
MLCYCVEEIDVSENAAMYTCFDTEAVVGNAVVCGRLVYVRS